MKPKESPKPKKRSYYDIKMEVMLPATLHYRVLAEDPEQAVELMQHQQPNSVKYKLIGVKRFKLIVFDAGCSVIKFTKNLFGR